MSMLLDSSSKLWYYSTMNARTDHRPQFRIRRYPYGVSYRRCRPRAPWIVKFARHKRTVYVGSYCTLEQAALAAEQFLKGER